MVRFMALNSTREMNKALGYYYFYYTTLYALAVLIGLSARLILPELAGGDCELALLVLAEKLLPEFLIGVVLAGLFSSTMSTADSLVLSASSVVTRDRFPNMSKDYRMTKGVTLLVLASSLGLVLVSASSVFSLVVIFGGMLSASFSPILLLRMRGADLPLKVMGCMALTNFVATWFWRELGYSHLIYKVAIGIVVGLAIGTVYKAFRSFGS
jgi:sodium/proline symporter